ncbi:MAG: efflux RND transporter periplasmic adaptor subunit [Holophagales bacterium]|nr:efflux RND transporter periplasmic adaptor subunit [Holophagales bacterium]
MSFLLPSRPWATVAGLVAVLITSYLAWLSWPVARGDEAEEQQPEARPTASGAGEPTPADPGVDRRAPFRVEVEVVELRDVALTASATGHLRAWRKVEIAPEVSGRVVWLGVVEGRRVGEGEPLFHLDDREARLELREAEVALLESSARFAISYAADGAGESDDRTATSPGRAAAQGGSESPELARARRQHAEGLIARGELDRIRRREGVEAILAGARQSDVRAATSGLAQAELRLERARLKVDSSRITAPFAGRVADLAVSVGGRVREGEACLVLLDDRRMAVEVDVLEPDLVRIRVGAGVRVRVPALDERGPGGEPSGGPTFGGRVYAVNPRVDSETGTGRITAVLDNPDGVLLPGVFAFVEVEVEKAEARRVVPEAAVLERQGRELVFRIEDGRALWTWVRTGRRADGRVVIEEGLEPGQQVAVGGHLDLAHEAPVSVRGPAGR